MVWDLDLDMFEYETMTNYGLLWNPEQGFIYQCCTCMWYGPMVWDLDLDEFEYETMTNYGPLWNPEQGFIYQCINVPSLPVALRYVDIR